MQNMMDMQLINASQAVPVQLDKVTEKPCISVVGLGYVGAVSTACLSSLGHPVIGVDVDISKVEQIASGISPIHEKDLDRLLLEGIERNLIHTTTDVSQAVVDSDVTFVSVGTPTSEDGGCDFSYIDTAARSIGLGLSRKGGFHTVVMRCSIPPGTPLEMMAPVIEEVSGKTVGVDFGICFNPEFLREGVAGADFHAPPKTVIGVTDSRSERIMRKIYSAVDKNVIVTSVETAEMVKYIDNVWHATKVTFANEVGRLCKPLGVDSHDVMDIFVQDTKLNLSSYYLKPGFAFGGSCLPKEVRAVAHIAEGIGVNLPLIKSLSTSNSAHIDAAIQMAKDTGARRIGVFGIAFKPGTDDLRESPILEVMAALEEEGIEIFVHDSAITKKTSLSGQLSYMRHGSPGLRALASRLSDMLYDDAVDVMEKSDAVIVTHAHETYRKILKNDEQTPVLDLVRLNSSKTAGPNYAGIGW